MIGVPTIDGKAFLESNRRLTDELLSRYSPSPDIQPKSLHEAMRYSLMAGGKRLRPILCLATYEYCGGATGKLDSPVHYAMAALEMVHTYSLIHDDLPCMDDDDLRRGLPTVHKKFGEALAVLAGDALHVVAFELMAKTGKVEAVTELSASVGTQGMLGGQIADLEAENRPATKADIRNIHTRKTGALIRGSVRIGAILAEADQATLSKLTIYGEKIGLAFQIVDDILDVEGDAKILGKEVGSDSKNNKATWPGVVGIDQARKDSAELIDQALALFGPGEDNALMYLARYIGQREK